ncbi:coiled-coil domain-containing protein 178 isoform X2 [Scyliorhinus canicula]|uniref:coiled-coil domain-containing protein 178 isoform X2 n=1 Tax=Scyliorhinus canicula TaxID=7830 RepID=UPI0018F644C7|nr:coiled-coil domain-containing protein 178 isoform X2 [Scyliorhinus canicula]
MNGAGRLTAPQTVSDLCCLCYLGSSACHNSDWLKIALPFVCKVTRHIRELEAKTELWFRQFTASVQSETQKRSPSSENVTGSGERYVMSAKFNQTVSSDLTSPKLCVEGVGLEGTEHEQTIALQEEARVVLSEIISLMEQLKSECQNTNEGLKAEREHVATLENKVDQLSLWWLQELPEAVQKEYEVCSQDVYELGHHIEVKANHLKNLQNQIANAEVLNRKLWEDINVMEKLEDQLEEKLDLEWNAIGDIVPHQEKVTEIFNKVDWELNKAMQELVDMHAQAQLKQKEMHEELTTLERKTAKLHNVMIDAKARFDVYIIREREVQDLLAEAEKLYNLLMNEWADLTQQKSINVENVKQLKIKYAEKQAVISVLTLSCNELRKTINDRTQTGNYELSEQGQELNKKLRTLTHLGNTNNEIELQIEVFNNDIKRSRKERNKVKKDIRQLQEAFKLNNGKLNAIRKQRTLVERSQNAVRAKLLMLTKTVADQEDQLKAEIEKLKKMIKDALIQRAKLQAKAKSEAEELVRIRDSADKKKESVLKKVTQAEKIVEDIETKFKRFEAIHRTHNETFLMLTEKLNGFKGKRELKAENLKNEKNDLQDQFIDGQKEHLDSSNQLNDTLKLIETIQGTFLQKQTLRTRLSKEIEKYKNNIAELQPILEAAESKEKNAVNYIAKLKAEVEIAMKRKSHVEEEHWKLINDRKEKRQEARVKLALAFMENTNRTEEYHQLQQTYKRAKLKLADTYNDRQKTEVCIKDYLQLSALHTKMHKALVDYYKQQGLYSQAAMARSQALSYENAQEIIAVQGTMSKSIQRISAFLQSLEEYCEIKEDVANKQCNQDGVIKDKKSHAVQITV